MRTFDLSPLFRTTIGYDRLNQLVDSALRFDDTPTYPPYNIEKTGENSYRITMAVAGFGENDVDVTVQEGTLIVSGKSNEQDGERKFLHRGIAGRAFERRFQLAENIKVAGGELVNGLLHIELEREIPEEKKPRKIAISGGKASKHRVIENADAT